MSAWPTRASSRSPPPSLPGARARHTAPDDGYQPLRTPGVATAAAISPPFGGEKRVRPRRPPPAVQPPDAFPKAGADVHARRVLGGCCCCCCATIIRHERRGGTPRAATDVLPWGHLSLSRVQGASDDAVARVGPAVAHVNPATAAAAVDAAPSREPRRPKGVVVVVHRVGAADIITTQTENQSL